MGEIVVVEIVVVEMPKDEVHLYQLYNLLLLVGEPLEGALEKEALEEALELLLLFFSSELLLLHFSSELLLLLICFSSVIH